MFLFYLAQICLLALIAPDSCLELRRRQTSAADEPKNNLKLKDVIGNNDKHTLRTLPSAKYCLRYEAGVSRCC